MPRADASALVAALDAAKARALTAAERALADLRADRPLDLADLLAWNERLEQAALSSAPDSAS